MDVKLIAKKIFWPIFIIIFITITFFISKSIYESQVGKVFGEPNILDNTEIQVNEFKCQSTTNNVAYVYLRGFADHNPTAFDYQRNLIGDKNILDFDYDEKSSLKEISENFINQFNNFASKVDVEEIIIIGQSAGGIIAAYSASELVYENQIELHTLASPLNGYNVPDAFLEDQIGFEREIALGFDSFNKPTKNIKAYHHKNINDEELESYCGDFKNFCNSIKIQTNDLSGSDEFFYNHTHNSIMNYASKLIIDCHN